MEILTATYCPYCKSRLDMESMLTLENLTEMEFYPSCPECDRTFMVFAKTEIKVNVSSIEDRIEKEKDTLLFWEQANTNDNEFKNERIKERKKRIKELETIKKRNDKEDN